MMVSSVILLASFIDGKVGEPVDLLKDQAFIALRHHLVAPKILPGLQIAKQCCMSVKKKFGTDYAVSTNTDIYRYDIATGTTSNLTEGMNGYDTTQPTLPMEKA
jgi:hypothetical protein